MHASLPWYDFKETLEHNDRFWSLFRQFYREFDHAPLPESLNRTTLHRDALLDENLFLTQTCGYDIAHALPVPLSLVATPIYKTDGATAGSYSSFLVKRKNSLIPELMKARFVANDDRSFSGFHGVAEILPVKLENTIWSGCHLKSIQMIIDNQADWAAIDAVTWGLLDKYRPEILRKLEVFSKTRSAFAPPLVTAKATSPEQLKNIQRTLIALALDLRGKAALKAMLIDGFRWIPEGQYRASICKSSRQNSLTATANSGQALQF